MRRFYPFIWQFLEINISLTIAIITHREIRLSLVRSICPRTYTDITRHPVYIILYTIIYEYYTYLQ